MSFENQIATAPLVAPDIVIGTYTPCEYTTPESLIADRVKYVPFAFILVEPIALAEMLGFVLIVTGVLIKTLACVLE